MPATPQIIDESGDKKYFTIVPNYVVNHSTVWEQGVYLVMKRLAGEEGKCFASQKEIAARLQVSQPTVGRVIQKLVKRGWIRQEGFVPGKTRPVKCWRIIDLWKKNIEFYEQEKIDKPQNISSEKRKDRLTTEYMIDKPQNKEEETIEEDNNNQRKAEKGKKKNNVDKSVKPPTGFQALDKILGRKEKKGGAAYKWQDKASRMAENLGFKPTSSWFKLFKKAFRAKRQGLLDKTYAQIADLSMESPEKYFYSVFNKNLKEG